MCCIVHKSSAMRRVHSSSQKPAGHIPALLPCPHLSPAWLSLPPPQPRTPISATFGGNRQCQAYNKDPLPPLLPPVRRDPARASSSATRARLPSLGFRPAWSGDSGASLHSISSSSHPSLTSSPRVLSLPDPGCHGQDGLFLPCPDIMELRLAVSPATSLRPHHLDLASGRGGVGG